MVIKLAESEYKKKLEEIESLREPTEFIFAVEKLSEGWDVDNVFQIVPLRVALRAFLSMMRPAN